MQASYETTSVGSQTEYQLMDTRGNKNLSYSSIMAEYVSLTITFSISEIDKRVRFHSAISSLYMLSITICLVMIKLLHIHYFIMQVLFKISSKNI